MGGGDMVWHECSLICSDACGCAAWHVAPTPRTAMPVAMQARSVRRAFKERQTPSLLPPGSPSSARTDDISNKTHRKNRKRNLPLSESDRGRITLSIFSLPARGLALARRPPELSRAVFFMYHSYHSSQHSLFFTYYSYHSLKEKYYLL